MNQHPISGLQSLVVSLALQWAAASWIAVVAAVGAANAMPVLTPSSFIEQGLTSPRLAGYGQMRFLGLAIYDARLWVGDDFQVQTFADHPLALQLIYHRSFSAQQIAKRSVQEIQRQRQLDDALIERWTQALGQWLPNVQAGDQLTGVYVPRQGMQLWRENQVVGTIEDLELARYFVGIWLSPQTSEPRLREALLAGLAKDTP